ncbi:SGNH hydrolase-type esterase domain-containing protein [Clohesyomyces aquaticus]|uniref:SGNH hydrolase-type esterase domain-containing protein n=1 Tax=Clohesyomyces aquaticus TaxID=1231657 RepID=A0A1Y1YQL1_9PLEO|nr:SGNH hydrolase-type esterase domain-containing protein [Clohesyomyces aquaticus]
MIPWQLFVAVIATLHSTTSAEQLPLKGPYTPYPWIHKFASLGDSYAAGLGAGSRIDWLCSRYNESYPNILHTSFLGHHPKRTHQFLACTGAASTEIAEKQASALQDDLDLLTISAGGNDVGLTVILNNCIYQFFMAGEDDCDLAIQDARERIANKTQLYKNVTQLFDAVKPKMNKDHGVVYVTGYAGFFGTDDELCNNVTWAVWKAVESSQKSQYLTLDRRVALDSLVRSVNIVLRQAAEAAGPNFHFIDYDAHIKASRGRYCESGVLEPAPNRRELDFYEWDTVDTGENRTELQHETGDDVPKGSFEGGIAERINKTLQEHPDWEWDPDKGFVNKSKTGVGGKGEEGEMGVVGDTISWMLPDSWKRVFHLRPRAHALIAELILEDLRSREAGRRKVVPDEGPGEGEHAELRR